MNYNKDLEGAAHLTITDDNKAAISMDGMDTVVIQLENEEEATQMIKEFEDESGELMYEEDAIFGKYKELHPFRP